MNADLLRGFAAKLAAVLLVVTGNAAFAADVGAPAEGQLYLVPGVLFMGGDDEVQVDDHVRGSIGIGANMTDRLALEFHYTEGDGDLPGILPNVNLRREADVQSYRIDAVYDFGTLGESLWRVHGVGGIGQMEYEIPGADDPDNSLANLGVGISTAITERLSVRGDTRLFYLRGDSDEMVPATNVGLRFVFAGPPTDMTADADGDGVRDRDDRCPGTAPGVDVDATGCPLDADRDGVPNASDACPGTGVGVSVDRRGCALDSDRDGVPDHLDGCPNTPRGDEVDERGCTVEAEDVNVRIELNLEFDFDSDALRPNHYSEIERVADFMEAHPATSAQLEGHTDSRGSEAYNQALSERRAYAVRDYLIDEADIDPRRITAVGYGEGRPVASNDTDSGRQRNRRVNAVIETREMSVRQRREN